ncbi:MAG: hypothetical protein D6677_01160 [Calditrichaeota bacterium]|nr:MAG: hypothetical protein D6677_01160 [Calditrichota bacterium]
MRASQIFNSTIGKKLILGITGLMWAGFVVIHLLENLLLLNPDPDPFNKWAHTLISLGPAIYFAELILVVSLLFHIFYAIRVTLENRKARAVRYRKSVTKGGASRRGIATASMIYTGLLLFIFIIIHLQNFKYGTVYMYTVDGQQIRDLYRTVHEYFSDPLNVTYYIVMMILLGLHLSHGVWSATQSLGLNGPRFTPFMTKLGTAVAAIVAIGFVGIPLFLLMNGGA